MKNYLKMFVIVVISLLTADANAKPWNNNTREHLFGTINTNNRANVSIQDEGFRWRNSFNFTINNQAILPQNWWFNKTIDTAFIDGTEEKIDSSNIDNFIFEKTDSYNNNYSSNLIHSHLAKIAADVKAINSTPQGVQCASATTAAVTIVIENNGEYYAFSKMINLKGQPYVATNHGAKPRNFVISISGLADSIKTNINNIIDCNIPDRTYNCSEGKILSKLSEAQLAVFKSTIKDLLLQARQNCQNINLNYNSVRLVVLHVGTTMDPCAICTRCLVGVSKRVNEDTDSYLRSTSQDSPIGGRMNNAKFLIEVSSNGHYNGGCPPTKNDSWNNYACGICSHTECAGHDGGEANPINISLNCPLITALAIPYGIPPNWILSKTFPPYVVFGRVNVADKNVVPAPGYNQNDGNCDNRAINMHFRHMCINNLPLVR